MTTDLLEAFVRVRAAAEDHMDERDKLGLGWTEETVTEVSTHKGAPTVQVVPFNTKQEGGGVGADFMWWWLDEKSGECFGMLVQAKAMRWTAKGLPRIDFGYRHGQQWRDLLATAERFEVPAVYAVYTGGRVSHALHDLHGMHVGDDVAGDVEGEVRGIATLPGGCTRCRRLTIGLITALQLSWDVRSVHWMGVVEPTQAAAEMVATFVSECLALEDVVDPELNAGLVHDTNLRFMGSSELRDWLVLEQIGVREVAKRIFAAVSASRTGAFKSALTQTTTLAGAAVFTEVPQDRGHFPVPYFEHVLRGLRRSPPPYVLEAMTGGEVPVDVAQAVGGLVVVTV